MRARGRVCPISYRHGAEALQSAMTIDADPVWVVGGLYGNVEALAALEARLAMDSDQGPAPRLVLNGDYHWFDAHLDDFDRIEAGVAGHTCLAGNVEAELGAPDDEAGCGCAYPPSVDDAMVARSNAIMASLQATAAQRPAAAAKMAALPRLARARIDEHTVGVVHGDPDALAGWGLAIDHLAVRGGSTAAADVRQWAQRADVAAFACSHTCLPWLGALGGTAVINNGSAGMPNFRGQHFALASRISCRAQAAPDACLAMEYGGLRFEAIPLAYDHAAWWRRFTRTWPPGSPAYASYADRIRWGPVFTPADACVTEEVIARAAPDGVCT